MHEHYLWLTLAHILQNKVVLSKRVMERFSTLEQVFSSTFEELCSVEGVTPAIAWEIKSFRHPSPDVEEEIKRVNDKGIQIIHFNHQDYPQRLKDIYDPPLYFYRMALSFPKIVMP